MRVLAVMLGLSLLLPGTVIAQGDRENRARNRQEMERQLRSRLAQIVREQLNLNDEQMRRLEQTNGKFETQRRELIRRERDLRQDLRREVRADDRANQDRVKQLLDQTLQLQRDRHDLVEAEQRELAEFLTPVQRAKFLGIQENVRRRVESARDRDRPRLGDPDSSDRERRRQGSRKPPA